MALPPVSVLWEPVTCMPAWVAKYAAFPSTTVASGYSVNAAGNLPADPAALARAAGQKIGVAVSLEAYTLARYVTSEVGNTSVAERVAVIQDALNRVRYIERSNNILQLLLYRQATGHPNRGFYGPIHGKIAGVTNVASAPYGRWAATSRDPSFSNLMLAVGILNGDIPADFNKGADDQNGPESLNDPVNAVRTHGNSRRQYWVGPLPGVNPFRTFQYRTMKDVDPRSALGVALINRGVVAMQSARPNWSALPTCPPSASAVLDRVNPLVILGAAGLSVAAVIGAALWRRRRYTPIAGIGDIGITARKGARTGAIEVDPGEVRTTVSKFLREFPSCEAPDYAEGVPYVRPPNPKDAFGYGMSQRDAETGRVRAIDAFIVPKPAPLWNMGGGKFLRYVDGSHRVELYPNPSRCGPTLLWRKHLTAVLTHELAHASDPGLRKQRGNVTNLDVAMNDHATYINDPAEVTAQLAEIHADLATQPANLWKDAPGDVLSVSRRWAEVGHLFTPKNRRRVLTMVARMKAERMRDDWRSGSTPWYRRPEIQLTRGACA